VPPLRGANLSPDNKRSEAVSDRGRRHFFHASGLAPIESDIRGKNASGDADASWVEVDFNEYDDRVFLKGKIKAVFNEVGLTHRKIRTKNAEKDHSSTASPADDHC
jgi:hypothetical protein